MATTRAPALAASSGEPSVLPLSATSTSPAMPAAARAARASRTQPVIVRASLRQGITTVSSSGAVEGVGTTGTGRSKARGSDMAKAEMPPSKTPPAARAKPRSTPAGCPGNAGADERNQGDHAQRSVQTRVIFALQVLGQDHGEFGIVRGNGRRGGDTGLDIGAV